MDAELLPRRESGWLDSQFGAALILAFIIHLFILLLTGFTLDEPKMVPVKMLNIRLGAYVPETDEDIRALLEEVYAKEGALPPQNEKAGDGTELERWITPDEIAEQLAGSLRQGDAGENAGTEIATPGVETPESARPGKLPPPPASAREAAKPISHAWGVQRDGEEALSRYEQLLSLWIERHKTYPEAAARAGLEGSGVIRLRIDRRGKLLYYDIDQSTGHPVLDYALRDLASRIDPLPPVPSGYAGSDQLEFLIAVNFQLISQ